MEKGFGNIAILGCGWLGLPLAKRLIGMGLTIKGSTTSEGKLEKFNAEGIKPYLIKVLSDKITGDLEAFLEQVETLIIDFPPGRRSQPASDYIRSMELLTQKLKKSSIKNVLFVSSISVYEDKEDFPKYTEEDKPNSTTERGMALIAVEKLLQSSGVFNTCILRFGGLLGPERHPVNHLAGRTGVANPKAPVNLIHQEDCIAILVELLQKKCSGEVFNAVFPLHPQKEKYYKLIAEEQNLPFPVFTGDSKGKIIAATKLIQQLEYTFKESI